MFIPISISLEPEHDVVQIVLRLYFLLKVGSQETPCLKTPRRPAFLSQSREITSRIDELYPILSHFNTVKLKGGQFRTDKKEIHVKAEPAGLTEASGTEPSEIVLFRVPSTSRTSGIMIGNRTFPET